MKDFIKTVGATCLTLAVGAALIVACAYAAAAISVSSGVSP